jgi:hypothetical protein
MIKDKVYMKLGEDVEEVLAWGLDVKTCYNIMYLLPANLDSSVKYGFIMNTLQKSLLYQGQQGWDITGSLKHIIEYENAGYSEVDIELAKIVLSAIEDRPDIQDEHFRIHSKGLGVKCLRKEGIKANEFVTEYFGEIYPSWRWYEKEDVIKHGQNSKKLSKELPDFYNIIFERHADDPEGYN